MLLKNVIKTFGKKWMQLLAIGFIIIMSSLTYTMMSYGLSGIEEPTERYLDEYNQEDFSVEMLNAVTAEEAGYPIMGNMVSRGIYSLSDIKKAEPLTFYRLIESRIREFGKIYKDFSVELREYKNIQYEYNGKTHKALVVKDSEKINLSYMEEGVKPSKYDEIAINKIYAQKNDIKIGEILSLKDRKYRVTGFVLVPDYTLPIFENSFNIDTGMQTLILMEDSEYERIDDKESFRLAGVNLTEDDIDTDYDKEALPFVTQLASIDNTMRSGAIYEELTQGKAMSLGLSIFIASIAIIIVAIMIRNLLQAERGQIGILKALGYRRREIVKPYFFSVLFIAFVMLIIGYILGAIYAEPLKNLYLDFYLLPAVKIDQSIDIFVTAIFVPLAFFGAVSWVIISRILGESSLALLKPHESESINRLSKLISRILSKAKGRTKFKYMHAIKSTASFFIFFIGITSSTILMSFSFMMGGMVDRMTVDYLNRVGYEYESYVDVTKRVPEAGSAEEKFLVYPYASVDETTVTLHGLHPRNELYKLYDEAENDLTIQIHSGAVITKGMSIKLNIKEGDSIRVKVDKDYYDFTVKGLVDEYGSDKVYLNIEKLSMMISENKSSRLYSGIYSMEKPSSEYYDIIISKEDLMEQSKSMANYTSFMSNIMIGSSAAIAVSILFVLTSFTVEKNYYTISLLKVMGYRRREVNSMILNSYFVYALISYFISLPIALATLNLLMDFFAKEYGLILPLEFKPIFVIRTLLMLIAIFLIGTYISRRKIEKIPLQEVLKTYVE